jgi:hypothetical protein
MLFKRDDAHAWNLVVGRFGWMMSCSAGEPKAL